MNSTRAMLAKACAGKKTSLKAALSDQRVVAGLGNIYVCEALFRARLSPKRIASTIADRNGRAERARRKTRRCHQGRAQGRDQGRAARRCAIIVAPTGSLGDFQHNFQVYDREGQPCPSCKGKIKRIVQGGRSTFYCPSCQK